VRIVATNRGRLTHNIAIVEDVEEVATEDEPLEYARSRTAHAGETVVARATLRPGRYRLVCTLANHDNLGQYGVLVVRQA
jgi:plastocyanin